MKKSFQYHILFRYLPLGPGDSEEDDSGGGLDPDLDDK